jgi:spore coat polysaccharide biosynthesis predicted glycosyltransferase SpsG
MNLKEVRPEIDIIPLPDNWNTSSLVKIIQNTDNLNFIKVLLTDGDEDIFFDSAFQQEILANHIKLVTITMFSKCHFYSHVVLNQNPLAENLSYETENYTKLLLGPEFMIFKKKLLEIADIEMNTEHGEKFFLFFGGSDSAGLSGLSLEVLNEFAGNIDTCYLALGAMNDNFDKKILNRLKFKCELIKNSPQIEQYMSGATMAITSGGLAAFELIYLKKPVLAISTSEREKISCEYLHDRFLKYCGHKDEENLNNSLRKAIEQVSSDTNLRKTMIQKAGQFTSGSGGEKIAGIIRDIAKN